MKPVPAEADGDALIDRLILEYLEAVDAGREPDRDAFLAAHPQVADELQAFFADQDHAARVTCVARRPSDETPRHHTTNVEKALPEVIGGYRLLRLLGQGGMGQVYEAEDSCGSRVAVKLLAPSLSDSATALERFRQEGRLASRITHPRCVFVHTAEEDTGQPYIVMELMTGITLKDLVEAAGPLEPADAVQKIRDVIEGLEEAHRAGVLHRDVKPANCYVDAAGRVKIGDFGLSRSLAAAVHLTGPGGFVGTPLFASPEQLRGEPLDPRTDVYSVTATLYYLLTGQAPFQHENGARVIARVVSEPAPPPRLLRPDLSPALEAVVLRGLERQRERRYPSLTELREDLRPFLPGEMTIAGLGLRAGAYLLDTLPFNVIGEAVTLWQIGRAREFTLTFYLMLVAPVAVYFFLCDGLASRSPGKWLLGLRITTADGWERPSWRQIVLRTAIFFATGGLVTQILIFFYVDTKDLFLWSCLSLVGYAVSLLARLGTMSSRNGYRCLHDLLSGTRVVQLPLAVSRGTCGQVALSESHRPTPALPIPLPNGHVLPRRLGPFRIHAALRWDEEERLLLADDPLLERQVWISWRPGAEMGVPGARRALGRPTRLRWLNGGREGDGVWDAYVAPHGAPLADWVATHGPLDWSATRLLLEQLVEELKTGAEDGTRPRTLEVGQVWLRGGGRLELLDSAPATVPRSPATEDDALRLVRGVSRLALLGRAEDAQSAPTPVPSAIPLHARSFLDHLSDPNVTSADLSSWSEELSAMRGRPTEVTPALRAFHLALTLCLVSVFLLTILCWSRNGALAQLRRIDSEMTGIQVLNEVLDNPAVRQDFLNSLPESDPMRDRPERYRQSLKELRIQHWEEFEIRIASLGWQESLAYLTPHIAHRLQLREEPERLEWQRGSGEGFQLHVHRQSLVEYAWITYNETQLRSLAARTQGDSVPPWNGQIRLMILTFVGLLLIVPILLIASAFLWRGGLSMRLAGLALVRWDGQPAGRLRCAARACLIWMPITLALVPIAWIDAERLDLLWLCPVFQGLVLFLCGGHAALALRNPRRSIVEWLVGVMIVPR